MASRKRKGFFALDVDQFERAADLGLEPATAYLALMAGTDQSNTVSAWGINAIVTHTFLQTRRGKSLAFNSLSKNMRRWCDAAGLHACTSHGLRKACARRFAEAGATSHEIAVVTGHATLKEVERYTRDAQRSGLADSSFEKLDARSKREHVVTNHPKRFAKKDDK